MKLRRNQEVVNDTSSSQLQSTKYFFKLPIQIQLTQVPIFKHLLFSIGYLSLLKYPISSINHFLLLIGPEEGTSETLSH